MPAAYEAVRDSLVKRGVKLKKAKAIAAAWWNKHNPDDTNPWNREKKKRKS